MKTPKIGSVSKSLCEARTTIIAQWEKKVRDNIRTLDRQSPMILRDHLPEMLGELQEALSSGNVEHQETGKAHGFQRAILTEVTLKVILEEYAYLREVLIQNLYPMGDLESAKLIHRFIDKLCQDSVLEFLRHSELRDKTLIERPQDTFKKLL